ncbi:MAG: LSM domain-containing protein [Candidatus Baldrarchaeia archaeon]
MERNPLRLLEKSVNNKVLVKLKDGTEFIGRLAQVDSYMNLRLVNAIELENGERKACYGEIFIRGNNILFIKPDATKDAEEYEE